MSIPTFAFLDTSILAGQQYNFASTALTSFVSAARPRSVRLVLPDPTRREVLRQIRERSGEALKALDDARKKAPFLSKWRHFPKAIDPRMADWEVRRTAEAEWATFLAQFEVVALGYEGLDLKAIMDWYDSPRAPFAPGKKRKEFPDAFAVAALARYAVSESCYVAVVSADDDFRAACGYYPRLLHFPSLPSLTELLLADADRVQRIRALLDEDPGVLTAAVEEEAGNLNFYHWSDQFEPIEDLLSLDFRPNAVRVVGLGDDACTVLFTGMLSYRVRLRWRGEDEEEGFIFESAHVADEIELSGTAKLSLAPGLSSIAAVTLVDLDQDEVEVTAEP